MKKLLVILIVMVLCFSFCGVAFAKHNDPAVLDENGNKVNWIRFKLLPLNELTDMVDTVWVIPIYDDYIKEQLYAAAQEAYPGAKVNELGRINMSGYDSENDYIFDYFGPFTAKVKDPNVHKGDKVVVFIKHSYDEQHIVKVKAFCVQNGTFSFRDSDKESMEANCVYVILHRDSRHKR